MKTYVHFIVAGDINFTQKHCCAVLDIFMFFTMTCSSNNTHTHKALLYFQYGIVTFQVHGQSCTASARLTAARSKCRAASDGVRLGRGLNLSDVSWRDSSENIMRLINYVGTVAGYFGELLCLEQFWGSFAESQKAVVIFVTSVCLYVFPYKTARLRPKGLS